MDGKCDIKLFTFGEDLVVEVSWIGGNRQKENQCLIVAKKISRIKGEIMQTHL